MCPYLVIYFISRISLFAYRDRVLLLLVHFVHQFLVAYHIRFAAELTLAERTQIDDRLLLFGLRMMATDVPAQILAMHIRVFALIARKLPPLRVRVPMVRQMMRISVLLIAILACEPPFVRVLNFVHSQGGSTVEFLVAFIT